eukprot:351127-Chlamydomonas_euryale.AAC.2
MGARLAVTLDEVGAYGQRSHPDGSVGTRVDTREHGCKGVWVHASVNAIALGEVGARRSRSHRVGWAGVSVGARDCGYAQVWMHRSVNVS